MDVRLNVWEYEYMRVNECVSVGVHARGSARECGCISVDMGFILFYILQMEFLYVASNCKNKIAT